MGRAEVPTGVAPLLSNWIVPTMAFDSWNASLPPWKGRTLIYRNARGARGKWHRLSGGRVRDSSLRRSALLSASGTSGTLELALKAPGVRQSHGRSSATAPVGWRVEFRLGRPRRTARRPGHRSRSRRVKNRILLENYYLPGDLDGQIGAFAADDNHLRYHESIGNW